MTNQQSRLSTSEFKAVTECYGIVRPLNSSERFEQLSNQIEDVKVFINEQSAKASMYDALIEMLSEVVFVVKRDHIRQVNKNVCSIIPSDYNVCEEVIGKDFVAFLKKIFPCVFTMNLSSLDDIFEYQNFIYDGTEYKISKVRFGANGSTFYLILIGEVNGK